MSPSADLHFTHPSAVEKLELLELPPLEITFEPSAATTVSPPSIVNAGRKDGFTTSDAPA